VLIKRDNHLPYLNYQPEALTHIRNKIGKNIGMN